MNQPPPPDANRSLWAELSEQPGGPTALRVAFFGVFLPCLLLCYFETHRPEPPGDSRPIVQTVARMLRHGDRDLTAHVPDANPNSLVDGIPYFVRPSPTRPGLYSSYPAGMEFFAWPVVVGASLTGGDVESVPVQLKIEVISAAIAGSAALALFFLTALRASPPGAAAVATFLLGTGSAFPTTFCQALWQQTGVVFWSLVVLFVEFRAAGRVGKWGAVAQGAACAMMIACRPSAATFVLPFGAWVLFRDWRRAAVVVASAAVAYLPWALLYQIVYGQPVGPALGFVTGGHSSDAKLPGGNSWTVGRALGGVLFSPGRGLFVYQPWALLATLLACRRVREGGARPLPPGWYAFALGFVAFHLAVVSSWRVWWGGACWGSRLASEVVPALGLLVLPAVSWLFGRRWGWGLLAVIALAGVWTHATYLFTPAVQWNGMPPGVDADPARLWDWQHPPFLYTAPAQ